MATRILTADDHLLVREGLASRVGAEPSIGVVCEARDRCEAVEKFAALTPDAM
ncbi:hypothetical protein [Gemmatimonas groenlandica]|uniref:Response regulatory domain-containing protein n=1 Tax=Gemmatimonas groenlandica TaxID=2732249 RepID=A0A6M4IG29_9BACT|nr:hypothetical protein [Gemmatimonas groenlandica]QJR34054.1 hypothetical protein HKW67_00260 [Gemmatimonas groenlandica]